MLNQKIELEYRRYSKNFEGIKFEDVEEGYLDNQNEITSIVDLKN